MYLEPLKYLKCISWSGGINLKQLRNTVPPPPTSLQPPPPTSSTLPHHPYLLPTPHPHPHPLRPHPKNKPTPNPWPHYPTVPLYPWLYPFPSPFAQQTTPSRAKRVGGQRVMCYQSLSNPFVLLTFSSHYVPPARDRWPVVLVWISVPNSVV